MRHKLTYILFLFLVLNSFTSEAQSDKQKALEAKRVKYQQELQQLNVLLFSNKKEEKSVVSLVEDLNYKVSVRRNLIKVTNDQANLLTREINANQNEISSLRDQLTALKEDYSEMIVKSYKNKSEQSRVMFLLSSDDFKQAYKRLQYIKQYADYQKEQGDLIKGKTIKLQELNTDLLRQKKDKDKLIVENRAVKKELEKELKEQDKLMTSIRQNLSSYSTKIKKKQQDIDAIDREIRHIEYERKRKIEEELEAKRNFELIEFKGLFKKANRWHQAEILRKYIAEVEIKAKEKNSLTNDVLKWLEWANNKVEWYDPFTEIEDEIFEKVNRETLEYKRW